jgi:hypothetical protein
LKSERSHYSRLGLPADSVGAATSASENVINALDRDVGPQHGAENCEF